MVRQQISLLLRFYWQPTKAASRTIDEGRLWFAVLAAAAAFTGLLAARGAFHPGMVFKALIVLAVGFVPGAILAATFWRGHESFGVLLRRDYAAMLTCALLASAAVCLPLAALMAIGGSRRVFLLVAGVLALLWFMAMAACSARTIWGIGYAASAATATIAIGIAFAVAAGVTAIGSSGYFLASPLVLFYGYYLLAGSNIGSNVRELGGGLRSRQHLRQQLEIATLNPSDADAHYQLGLIYQDRHQYDEARRRFQRAIEIDSREADPFFQLGKIDLEEGKAEEAIAFLSRAAALDDKCGSHEVWRELGRAYLSASRPDEACAALARYVERRPYDPEGLYYHGEALLALARAVEAGQAFTECKAAVDTMPPHRRRQVARWGRMASGKLRQAMEQAASSRA